MTMYAPDSPLQHIREQAIQLSHTEVLQLIAYLIEQAQQTAPQNDDIVQPKKYYWRDMAGIAPNLLEGQDAQEWVNKIRAEEWEREIPR